MIQCSFENYNGSGYNHFKLISYFLLFSKMNLVGNIDFQKYIVFVVLGVGTLEYYWSSFFKEFRTEISKKCSSNRIVAILERNSILKKT